MFNYCHISFKIHNRRWLWTSAGQHEVNMSTAASLSCYSKRI